MLNSVEWVHTNLARAPKSVDERHRGTPLHQQSRELQELVGDITILERLLVEACWIPSHDPTRKCARWEYGTHVLTVELQGQHARVASPSTTLPTPIAEQLHLVANRQ